jgi:phosphatidylserine/phosphatidylglycerophosphate/cardiolipin synthase-like enzyme
LRSTKVKAKLVADDSYLKECLKLLDSARTRIDLLSFSFGIGSAGGKLATTGSPYKIAEKLVEQKKKKKKLKIRVFLEGERETADRNVVTGNFLEKAGIEVHYGATHAKGFAVDDESVLFGSTNLTHQSITKNNEANLLITSKEVTASFREYFDHLWNGGSHGEIELAPPMLADGAFKDELIEMIDSAKEWIGFSIYFFNHKEIEAALIRAHERGIEVTGFIHQHASFALSYVSRSHSTAKRMQKAGIRNITWSQPHTFSHSKYLIKDGKEIALGTGNWLVEDVEIHPQLYIHLKDTRLAKSLTAHLMKQITERSAPYSLRW